MCALREVAATDCRFLCPCPWSRQWPARSTCAKPSETSCNTDRGHGSHRRRHTAGSGKEVIHRPPPPFSRRRRPSDDTCRAARHDIPGRLEWQHFSPVYTVRQCAPTHALFGPSRRCGEAAKPSKFITSGWSLWHGGGLLVSVDVTYLLLIVVC